MCFIPHAHSRAVVLCLKAAVRALHSARLRLRLGKVLALAAACSDALAQHTTFLLQLGKLGLHVVEGLRCPCRCVHVCASVHRRV